VLSYANDETTEQYLLDGFMKDVLPRFARGMKFDDGDDGGGDDGDGGGGDDGDGGGGDDDDDEDEEEETIWRDDDHCDNYHRIILQAYKSNCIDS
jgi:hypothetical protein